MPPVLVTGANGRVGRIVVDLLIDAGVPVRALTHRSEATTTLPPNVEVFEELSPEEFRRETEASWPRPIVDMLLDAWGATLGRPAYVTSTVSHILGSASRSLRESVVDHATAFLEGPAAGTTRAVSSGARPEGREPV